MIIQERKERTVGAEFLNGIQIGVGGLVSARNTDPVSYRREGEGSPWKNTQENWKIW